MIRRRPNILVRDRRASARWIATIAISTASLACAPGALSDSDSAIAARRQGPRTSRDAGPTSLPALDAWIAPSEPDASSVPAPDASSGGEDGGESGGEPCAGSFAGECRDRWVDLIDPALPLGGLFYGSPHFGDNPNHGPWFHEASSRVRVLRGGSLVRLQLHNRVFSLADYPRLADHCRERFGADTYEECVNHPSPTGLYSHGTGGRILIEVHADSGAPDHLPTAEVLATATETYVPADTGPYPNVELDRGIDVVPGQILHLVHRQLAPEEGEVVLNGAGVFGRLDPSGGPFFGSTLATLIRREPDSAWAVQDRVLPYFMLEYADGWTEGWTYAPVGAASECAIVTGDVQVRQRFTVAGPTRRADGVWLRLLRRSDGRGGPRITLRAGGTVLWSGELDEDAITHTTSDDTSVGFRESVARFAHVSFGEAIPLRSGVEHELRIEAPPGATFYVEGQTEIYAWSSAQRWTGAIAERSDDGAATWGRWQGRSGWNLYDLTVLFTLEGMPRQLP
jgi:hypothetical protein